MKVLRKIIKIDEELCNGCGQCVISCAEGALKIIDGKARVIEDKYCDGLGACIGECPIGALKIIEREAEDFDEKAVHGIESTLTNWPVKLRLIPANAPFLKNADILIMADCFSVAYPALHKDILKDKVVITGCPKFDDSESYIGKLSEIFKTAGIKSLTVANMEVPCCLSLFTIVKKGMEKAMQQDIPMKSLVISARGKIKINEKANWL